MNELGLTPTLYMKLFPSSRWFVFLLTVWPLRLMQVNVPRCLPFSGVGLVKQAACGGTGCAVLNGEPLLRAVYWEAAGGMGAEGLVSSGSSSQRGEWACGKIRVQSTEGEGD